MSTEPHWLSHNDSAGYIHKKVFIVRCPPATVLSALLVIAVAAVVTRISIRWRLYRRRRQHRPFGVDDGFLVFGLACAAAATIMELVFVEKLYIAEALTFRPRDVAVPPRAAVAQGVFVAKYHRYVLELILLAVCAVKFSFLFFFRHLIWRFPGCVRAWWWAVLAFTVVTTACTVGTSAFSCTDEFMGLEVPCFSNSYYRKRFALAYTQIALDIISDILILTFPVRIIWTIKVRRRQKVALASSLCLTFVIIALTIVRAARLRHPSGVVDATWGVMWCFVPALMGLILTAGTALRALFVSHDARSPAAMAAGDDAEGTSAPGRPAHARNQFCLRNIDRSGKKPAAGGGGHGAGGVPRSALELPASLWSDGSSSGDGGGVANASVALVIVGEADPSAGDTRSSSAMDLGGRGGSSGEGSCDGCSERAAARRWWWWLSRNMLPRATITGLRTLISGSEAGRSARVCNLGRDVEHRGSSSGPNEGLEAE